ncbi:MAG: hypothetical protein ACUVR3_14235, partial [Candidatus Roseilinea sp.]
MQDVAQLLPEAERAEAGRVFALTGGNPFNITEYLSREGRAAGQGSIAARLGVLSTPARAALEAAAVLGEQVAFRLWSVVAQEPPLTLAAASEELTDRHFLQPTGSGYAFVHDVLRSAVYDNVDPARRRLLHSRAADALATLDPDNWRARAFQPERGGRTGEASAAYRQVGVQESERFAFREAQEAFARALALLPAASGLERVEVTLAFAQACDILGERERAQVALDEALRGARALQH